MDGRGRATDNIFTERLWRSVKYEEVYLHEYDSPREARRGIAQYMEFYNNRRPHQSLENQTPAEVYRGARRSGHPQNPDEQSLSLTILTSAGKEMNVA